MEASRKKGCGYKAELVFLQGEDASGSSPPVRAIMFDSNGLSATSDPVNAGAACNVASADKAVSAFGITVPLPLHLIDRSSQPFTTTRIYCAVRFGAVSRGLIPRLMAPMAF